MNFFVLNKKKIIVFFIVLVMVISGVLATIKLSYTSSPKRNIIITLDAGHGGRDGGCVGCKTKIKESDLTLNIVKKLQNYFKSYGFNVVLTRKDDKGLYGFGKNKKLQDMEARKKIINENNSDCVISIHMNSCNNSSVRGAQSFYTKDDEISKNLSNSIQEQLNLQLPTNKKTSITGDYYILKCAAVPSVLVECGYLSNAEEEVLLINDVHQEKIAYAIFCGTLKFFNFVYS